MKLDNPLQTDRMILQPLTRDAAEGAYLKWMNDPEVMRFTESRFRSHKAGDLRGYIQQMNDSQDNLLLGMFTGQDQAHIGNIKLGPINPHHARADIGIILGLKEYWGQGLATEAIRAVSEHALGPLGLHRVTAGIYANNIGSIKAFRKAGFRDEARLEGYWLSDEEWVDEIFLCRFANQD